MERTCEGVIVLTKSDEGRNLRVIDCLFCMSCLSHTGGYVYDDTGVNQLRLSGPVPEIRALLPALTRVGSGILSLIGRRYGWDESSECMSLSCCRPPSIRGRGPRYKYK